MATTGCTGGASSQIVSDEISSADARGAGTRISGGQGCSYCTLVPAGAVRCRRIDLRYCWGDRVIAQPVVVLIATGDTCVIPRIYRGIVASLSSRGEVKVA